MYLKTLTIDGFKSYGHRQELNGFDPAFNAITGLNGSGKSNILDAICFLMGITTLSKVRVKSLQELVYKNGQTGINKATVTAVFDNRVKSQSPIGYEAHDEIVISRQIVIGGKNRHLINGMTVPGLRVSDLFRSVQLNVNNPHFLIMQGTINKVTGMKPKEILGMVEEACGTSMFEDKKCEAIDTLRKKDNKIREINEIFTDFIKPELDRCKAEKAEYMEFQRLSRLVGQLTKVHTAWQYTEAGRVENESKATYEQVMAELEENEAKIQECQTDIETTDQKLDLLRKQRDAELGAKLSGAEEVLKSRQTEEARVMASVNELKNEIKSLEKRLKQTSSSLKDDEAALKKREGESGSQGEVFRQLKERCEQDEAALEVARQRLKAVSSGQFLADDGSNASLQEQLMGIKESLAQGDTAQKKRETELRHDKDELKRFRAEVAKSTGDASRDQNTMQRLRADVAKLTADMNRLNYEDGSYERVDAELQGIHGELNRIQRLLNEVQRRNPQLQFHYTDPQPNWDKRRVRGVLANLFTIKDPKYAQALEKVAGGRLFHVVVDTNDTATAILQRGRLQRRTTFVPLNVVRSYRIPNSKINFAKQLVGNDRVHSALSLVEYPPELEAAMVYAFGGSLIADDVDIGSKVCFHPNVHSHVVTLDGEAFNPEGVMDGGYREQARGTPLLTQLYELKEARTAQTQLEQRARALDGERGQLRHKVDRYNQIKADVDMKSEELRMTEARLEQTDHARKAKAIETLEAKIETATAELESWKTERTLKINKQKDIEGKLRNAKEYQKEALKEANSAVAKAEKAAKESRANWESQEKQADELLLELQTLKEQIQTQKEQEAEINKELAEKRDSLGNKDQEIREAQESVAEARSHVKREKDALNALMKESGQLEKKKNSLKQEIADRGLKKQKLETEGKSANAAYEHATQKLVSLKKDNPWIQDQEKYFGKEGTLFDFKNQDPKQVASDLAKVKNDKEKIEKKINFHTMDRLQEIEGQYDSLVAKLKTIKLDKVKIEKFIQEIENKKEESIIEACQKINSDFGKIFSTLLPGSSAKLVPPVDKNGRETTVLDGLELKVAFGNAWKESLVELSGGQRSLLALSLILAMLVYKPAPLYILDEIDAALDLSHTQNIGKIIKEHFKQSQFVIVSLKDGMFNNANVLFRTAFKDGMSEVKKTGQRLNA